MGLCLILGIYLIATTVLISKDGVFYIDQAQVFARDPLGVARTYPPGYPALLWIALAIAGAFSVSDSVLSWVHISQSVALLCRTLALVPLYFLSKSVVGATRAFWAVLILIVLPYPAQYGSDVLRDWPYVLFLSLGFWLLYQALRRRVWWLFALVGLDAAAGYLIQPACAQLIVYSLLGLAVVLREDAKSPVLAERRGRATRPSRNTHEALAALLLIAGFAGPVLPFALATGTLIPHQLRPASFNSPPVIISVGGKGASPDPLDFEVHEGELLQIAIEASDPQGDDLEFSLVSVPAGSRPVYQSRPAAGGDCFMTLSDDERNALLETYPPVVRGHEDIEYYAYARADACPGLQPVHRLWSPVLQRHFYTIRPTEKDAVLAGSLKGTWTYEGVAFYAFAEGRRPPDAVPVHRVSDGHAEHSWAITWKTEKIGTVPNNDRVAWYAHVAGAPPAGVSMQDRTLRWQPGPGRHGEYQLNIIVSDGDMETCQLVTIRVVEPKTASSQTGASASVVPPMHSQSALRNPPSTRAGSARLPQAVDRLFDKFAESLMVFFLVPWAAGLYYRMRYEADRLERVLTMAVIAVNAGLILGRYAWVAPTMERRYCLALVVLTIFYIPVGLEQIALRLSRRAVTTDHSQVRTSVWFHVLALIGIGICLPKLLTPLAAEKSSYVQVIHWLRDNTRPEQVTAVPDARLAFYAQRPAIVYRGGPDPRRADYVVRMLDADAETTPPEGWSEEYSIPVDDRGGRRLVIYNTHRRKGP